METILIKCPHCNEKMQAPADRESILCMFCGARIDLKNVRETGQAEENADFTEEKAPADPAKCQENLQFVLSHVGAVFRDYTEKVKAFKRNSYTDLFERHKEENYGFYTELKLVLDNAAEEELDGICRRIAEAFIREQEQALAQVRKKNERFSLQMDKNMFMVIYVLPSIKEMRNKKADRLADVICEEWGKAFRDSNISAADYESIMEGFKRKLCYVTTAVCRNLNKGEDCEELRLIKDFRDGYLSSTEEGRAMIEEYYDIAPTLVKRIDKDAGAQEKYLWLWNTYLAPCVEFIRAGQEENCRETYCSMIEELRAEYMRKREE